MGLSAFPGNEVGGPVFGTRAFHIWTLKLPAFVHACRLTNEISRFSRTSRDRKHGIDAKRKITRVFLT